MDRFSAGSKAELMESPEGDHSVIKEGGSENRDYIHAMVAEPTICPFISRFTV